MQNFSTEEGCHRGKKNCEYLHVEDKEPRENMVKSFIDKEVQVQEKREVKEKEIQTESETCVCKDLRSVKY